MNGKKAVNARKTRTKKTDIQYGYDSKFPTVLRKLLKKTGTTQDELAKHCDVARQSVAQWKDGKTKPDIYYLELIAEFFNCSTDHLLGRTSTASSNNFVQKACTRYGLNEFAFEWLEHCNKLSKIKFMEDDLDIDVRKVTEIRKSLAMLNNLLSFNDLAIDNAYKKTLGNYPELNLDSDFDMNGSFIGDVPFPLIAIKIFAVLHDYCYQTFEDVELSGIVFTANDLRKINILHISSLLEILSRYLKGGVTNGKH